MTISLARPRSAFQLAIAASLVAGTLLMFGSLQYAATHMRVTM